MKDTDKTMQTLLAAAKDVGGKKVIACKAAFKLAEEMGLTYKAMGELCNQAKVKIVACQLGCFQ